MLQVVRLIWPSRNFERAINACFGCLYVRGNNLSMECLRAETTE